MASARRCTRLGTACAILACLLTTRPTEGADALVRKFPGSDGGVDAVAFLAGGKEVLLASNGSLRRLDLQTGRQLARYEIPWVNDLAVFPDGRRVLIASGLGGGDQMLTLWDFARGRQTKSWKAHDSRVNRVRLLPGARQAVTGGGDSTARLWDLATGKEIRRFGRSYLDEDWDGDPPSTRRGESIVIAVSPSGKFLATADGAWSSVKIWEIRTGKCVNFWTGCYGQIWSLDYSPDGKYLLTGTTNADRDAGVQLWDARTGRLVRRWKVGAIADVRFAPDGRRFMTAGLDSFVRLWDVSSPKPLLRFAGHRGWVRRVVWGPGGKTALSAGNDQTARLWRVPD
jgi:WD40 repeat protein